MASHVKGHRFHHNLRWTLFKLKGKFSVHKSNRGRLFSFHPRWLTKK